MATNKTNAPRMFNVGDGSLLGGLLNSLNTSLGEPVAPTGDRPGFTPINGVDMDALAGQFAPGGYGMRSQIVSDLHQNNPKAFKTFTDELYKQRDWDTMKNAYDARVADTAALKSGQMSVGQMGSLLRNWWRAQSMPGKAAGIGLTLGNIGGLTDNDKFGGQLGGLVLGGLGSRMGGFGPGASALLTLGGGELGALFDKLRAKREGQRGQTSQQQQARR